MNYQIISNLTPEYLESLTVRFWAKVDTSNGPDSCWEWQASLMPAGYGQIGIGRGTVVGAHRLAYELEVGPIKDGYLICHKCDNRKCCNPFHLFLGTHAGGWRYNRWIVDTAKRGDYIPTWQLVVAGVAMGLVMLFIIAWPVAIIVFLVYASLGVFLAWGDDRRERDAAVDYARHLRSKNKILQHLPGVDEE